MCFPYQRKCWQKVVDNLQVDGAQSNFEILSKEKYFHVGQSIIILCAIHLED